ncbi:n/a [Ectocarpus siliculosus]|uniref:N/a n=1 Tax=Ectocarpus siliculosus TaxID=2880 RepID=D8LQP0_ECTSI|nr:n/a [Ectocarpus siliculosus]|eukprot:CBN78804.1 n/a [Ectocarpus siliculosus]
MLTARVSVNFKLDGDEPSNTAASGELLTLPWDPRLALSGWGRGRASVLKFEVSRGPGRPVEWTGFVPTAGLVHSPRCVFERAICLTGRLGSEPPTSARTAGSTGASAERRTVSLEVAMMFQPVFPAGIRGGSRAAGVVSRGVVHQEDARRQSFDHRPFHPDLRRIACEGGELVVHCLRARNLRLPRQEKSVESRDAQPEIFLTVLPDGGEVQTSTSYMGPGGRHPVWGQSLTLSIADAATARVVVRVRNVNQVLEDNVLGEVELSLAGLIAAEHGVAAAAALPGFSGRLERPPSGSSLRVSLDKEVASDRQELADNSYGSDSEDHVDTERFPGRKREPSGKNPVSPHKIKPCGVEAWFPLFVAGRQGGSREREVAGEVRLCCRFLSTDFMMQREVTAGADEGDNGPVGALRYALERRPGRLFMTIRCCRALPKAMIGERAPLVEARLRHGGWQCSTRRQTGLNPVFNENMAVDVLWTPQDFNSPEVILEVKDKALGGGLLAAVRVAVAPFILHPMMPADIWIPLLGGAGRETNSGIYIGLIYIPSVDEIRNMDEHLSRKNPTSFSINSIEHIADPEYSAVLRRARRGVVHVQIMSARGLPASSKDPQVGVRLRVGDHCGGPLPPFQRTAAIRGGRGEPQFNSTFFLDLQQDAPGLEEESKRAVLGRTPMLEVEARCCRGKGKVLGTVEIPIFPLWFMGHMTRAWYPMRSCDGEAEAGRVFIGLQFIADGKSGENGGMTAASVSDGAGTVSRRRRYLFLEVRQGRELRHTHAESDRPVVHVEMLGSGARGKTPPARGGGPDPAWADGAGLLALPYPLRSSGGGFGSSNEVLRITILNEQRRRGDGQEKGTGRSIEGGVRGDAMGHKVRSTPGRRGVRTSLLGEDGGDAYAKGGTIFSWDDTCPHRMRFNNAFNKQPTTLHVSVVQGDRVVGFASVGVEAVVHDGISTMARETAQSTRRPRGSAHDVGPVGLREEDFGHSVQAWYPLHAPDDKTTSAGESALSSSVSGTANTEVGRVLIDLKFAPHPNLLVRNWQEGAATLRANGIAAMKAIFYRLNRSGNLVIETEDLRLALVDAVDEYLATSTAAAKAAVSGTCKPFAGTSRASQAGEFLLLMSEGSKSSFGEGSNAALSKSAADSILSMMDRDRTAEVTFAEFCMFLSRAASRQADAAVGDLVNELAEDNDDESCDSDSDDDALGSDASRNAGANCDEPHGRRRTRRVPSLIGLVERSTDQTVRNTQLTGRQDRATTTENGRRSSPKAFSDSFQYPESAKKPNMDPPELFTAEPPGRVQDKLSKASRAQDSVDVSRGPNRPATPAPHHTTEGNETAKYVLPEDITSWTVGHVLNWLSEDMQLPQHLHKFRDASIDGLVLCDLTDVLLEEGLGISDSLHRLKILRHMQKLSKKQQQHHHHHHKADTTREDRPQTSPPPRAYAARKTLGVMTGSSDTKDAQAGSPANRSRQTGCTAVGVDREEDPLPLTTGTLEEKKTNSTPIPPSPPGEEAGAKRGTGQGVQQTEDTHEDERFSAGSRSGFSPDEEAFALTMKEVRGEFVTEEVGGEGSPELRTGVSQLKNRKRHICIPANATTSEVHEVVQTAMWATAALLEDTNTGEGERVESTGDYPEAWWGSSEGGSTAKSDSIDGADFDYASIGGGTAEKNRENRGNKRARLLFNELCSFQQGGAKSSGTARGLKLTRHRLEVGIRSLLKIEMRWEQWQLFLDSLPRLRTQGFLNPGDFFEAFGFHPLLRRPTTPRSALGGSKQRKFEGESFDFEPGRSFDKGSLVSSEATSGWETSATQDISNFREFVLGIADALRTCRATLGGVISTFDKRGTGKVSVSEFMSLVKALTRKRRYSARARAMTGGFDRKQAYLLLRCVDKDGDRSVVLRDLVAFVFATWTEELERLTGGNSEPEEVRQRRRQLQKDLRRHFPANFRRALGLDAVEPDTGHQGPFAALLARVGLDFPSPPSPRSQPTFVSPRRAHRQRRSETARSSSSCPGADVKFERESVVEKERGERWQGGRKVRAMSVATPARRSRGDRPATSDGQRRLGFTANKELHRRTSFEAERVLSLPPRVDLSAMNLTASHNRELLAQGTFQTSGVREGTFS